MNTINVKDRYERFVANLRDYHERGASINSPAEMIYQYEHRLDIIDNLSDLCNNFVSESHYILDAFDQYKNNMKDKGVIIDSRLFTNIIRIMVSLISEKEEIYVWSRELCSEYDFLSEKDVSEMEPSDIEKMT